METESENSDDLIEVEWNRVSGGWYSLPFGYFIQIFHSANKYIFSHTVTGMFYNK